jgi:hypothetical protein
MKSKVTQNVYLSDSSIIRRPSGSGTAPNAELPLFAELIHPARLQRVVIGVKPVPRSFNVLVEGKSPILVEHLILAALPQHVHSRRAQRQL